MDEFPENIKCDKEGFVTWIDERVKGDGWQGVFGRLTADSPLHNLSNMPATKKQNDEARARDASLLATLSAFKFGQPQKQLQEKQAAVDTKGDAKKRAKLLAAIEKEAKRATMIVGKIDEKDRLMDDLEEKADFEQEEIEDLEKQDAGKILTVPNLISSDSSKPDFIMLVLFVTVLRVA
jgi:hypothetical protein